MSFIYFSLGYFSYISTHSSFLVLTFFFAALRTDTSGASRVSNTSANAQHQRCRHLICQAVYLQPQRSISFPMCLLPEALIELILQTYKGSHTLKHFTHIKKKKTKTSMKCDGVKNQSILNITFHYLFLI